MRTFEIYWNDLTDDAKERLKDLNHDNVDLSPLAIIELEDDYTNYNEHNLSLE